MLKPIGEEKDAPNATRCCVAVKRGTIQKMDDGPMKTLLLAIEKARAGIREGRAPFHVIKSLFGYHKVRYRGWPGIRRHSSASSD